MIAPERRRWLALVVLSGGQLMIVLDVMVVNVALPSIKHDLHFTEASLAWVVNGYLITFAGLLLLAGRLGDLLGRKRILLYGLVVFTAASALCGVSWSSGVLIGARALQGIGAALTGAVLIGMVTATFPDPPHHARAMAVFASTSSVGATSGLVAGGVITQFLGWHWVFLINVPVGLIIVPLCIAFVEGHQGIGFGRRVDALGAVLITAALMVGTYAIVEASARGWGSTVTLGGGALALALIVLFVLRENAVDDPLIPLRMFRRRNVAVGNAMRVMNQFGVNGSFFLLSIYMQDLRHFSALQTGAAFLPQTLVVGAVSMGLIARLVNRFGAKPLAVIGLAIGAVGYALLIRMPAHASYLVDIAPAFVLIGLGNGLAFMPTMTLTVEGVPASDLGAASGMYNVSQQAGGSIGLALLATLSASHAHTLLERHQPLIAATVAGNRVSMAVAAVVSAAAALLALVMLRRTATNPAVVQVVATGEP